MPKCLANYAHRLELKRGNHVPSATVGTTRSEERWIAVTASRQSDWRITDAPIEDPRPYHRLNLVEGHSEEWPGGSLEMNTLSDIFSEVSALNFESISAKSISRWEATDSSFNSMFVLTM